VRANLFTKILCMCRNHIFQVQKKAKIRSSQKINTLYVHTKCFLSKVGFMCSATLLKGHFIERCYLALLESFHLYCGLICKYKSLGGAFNIQFHTQYFLFWYAKVLTCLEHNSFSPNQIIISFMTLFMKDCKLQLPN
jgi:hypothetical protein